MVVNIIISFIIAVLSGLGVGGGGLFAVYLSVFSDVSQLTVQGFNLLFFLFCASASVAVQIFRRKLLFGVIVIMSLFGLLGSLFGSYIAVFLPEMWLRRAFGVMLVAGGIVSLRSSIKRTQNTKGIGE